jgi:hypothetical protein
VLCDLLFACTPQALLAAGADPLSHDKNGFTAAKLSTNADIRQLLLTAESTVQPDISKRRRSSLLVKLHSSLNEYTDSEAAAEAGACSTAAATPVSGTVFSAANTCTGTVAKRQLPKVLQAFKQQFTEADFTVANCTRARARTSLCASEVGGDCSDDDECGTVHAARRHRSVSCRSVTFWTGLFVLCMLVPWAFQLWEWGVATAAATVHSVM